MSKLYNDFEEECCSTHEGSAAFYLDRQYVPGRDRAEAILDDYIDNYNKKHPELDLEIYQQFLGNQDVIGLVDETDPPF